MTGPGQAWHTAGKGVKSNYLANTESSGTDSLHCIRFGFSLSGNTGITFTRDNSWPAGSLTVERTEDEDGRTLWVFKDMRDLTVLERRQAEAATNSAGAVYADTYYLYDAAGRLVAVLPPELSDRFSYGTWSGGTGDSPAVEGFAFQYRYDTRGRMIAKKLPGADWTYYNIRSRRPPCAHAGREPAGARRMELPAAGCPRARMSDRDHGWKL